jgi:hypothetical protein
MNKKFLFVSEGKKPEQDMLNRVVKSYNLSKEIIFTTFGTDIYNLYEDLKDEKLSLLEVLREKPANEEILEGYVRKNFSNIFLFFDYDPHVKKASDDKIKELISFFDNETENGKLFISYPMVEATKYYKKSLDSCWANCCVNKSDVTFFKDTVAQSSSFNNPIIRKSDWDYIFIRTIEKANCIVNDSFSKPDYDSFLEINQNCIFENQLEKFIANQKVAVLSGIPLFVIDYLGKELYEIL